MLIFKSKLRFIYTRETLPYEASRTGALQETDLTDCGTDVSEPAQTSTQVTSLRLWRDLDRDGAFLDPEKYDPIKHLGSGGFAEACLLSCYKLLYVGCSDRNRSC